VRDRWSAATSEEIEERVERELRACPSDLAALFAAIRIPFRAVPILRSGAHEQVFVIAEQDGVVVYYEDVEDGFNLSRLAPDGSIATPGHEQWRLRDALFHLSSPCGGTA
jgi:hypothetical protein